MPLCTLYVRVYANCNLFTTFDIDIVHNLKFFLQISKVLSSPSLSLCVQSPLAFEIQIASCLYVYRHIIILTSALAHLTLGPINLAFCKWRKKIICETHSLALFTEIPNNNNRPTEIVKQLNSFQIDPSRWLDVDILCSSGNIFK